MNYLRFGKGSRMLVILPGLSVESVMNYADTVADAYSPLTDGFTIFLFDRRNDLPESYTVSDMARDTASAMQTLGLEQVCLFGVSMGGMTAMTVAIEHPELVSRLVLGSTSSCITAEQYQIIEKWIHLAGEGQSETLSLAFGEAIFPRKVFEQSRDALTVNAKMFTEDDLARFIILAEGIKDFNVTNRLKDISCPALVIGSMDDSVLGAEASLQIAEQLKGRPDCELYMYDGYGHAVYDLAPDYKDRILRFMTRNLSA